MPSHFYLLFCVLIFGNLYPPLFPLFGFRVEMLPFFVGQIHWIYSILSNEMRWGSEEMRKNTIFSTTFPFQINGREWMKEEKTDASLPLLSFCIENVFLFLVRFASRLLLSISINKVSNGVPHKEHCELDFDDYVKNGFFSLPLSSFLYFHFHFLCSIEFYTISSHLRFRYRNNNRLLLPPIRL